MSIDAGDVLVRVPYDHTLGWERGTAEFFLPARQKSDVSHLAHPETFSSRIDSRTRRADARESERRRHCHGEGVDRLVTNCRSSGKSETES